mgnify:CR=1 FL=1
MKKNLKLLVIGLLVAVAATLTCAFMPACGGDGATAYSVKVVCAEEGFDYTQITVQWCLVSADKQETIQCYGIKSVACKIAVKVLNEVCKHIYKFGRSFKQSVIGVALTFSLFGL